MGTTRFRSGLEKDFAELLKINNIDYQYEKVTLSYLQPAQKRKYKTDFSVVRDIFIETKGRFTSADRKKMLLVKEQHPDKTFIMVFSFAKKKLYKGSPTTYAEWCDKNGFHWIDFKQLKENICLLSGHLKTKPLSSKTQQTRKLRQSNKQQSNTSLQVLEKK